MQLEKYPFVKTEEVHFYEFNSKGPKGVVKKLVSFDSMSWKPVPTFNLSFGDWDWQTGEVNDRAVTNNADRKKVLSTVAGTVLEFMKERPGRCIYAKGSTPARTRLYQMGIVLVLHEIQNEFDVYGSIDGFWHKFEKGKNYKSFLLVNKSFNFDPNNLNIQP
jgi:hypothetical protein